MEKKGHQSLIGVTTLIANECNKIVDLDVRSLFCNKCSANKKGKTDEEFEDWYNENHEEECTRNHDGTSGAMEAASMIELF